ncbi:MAG TPA: hypothetical protein VGG74_19370 [Kofleriaceae bacterium]|jgi:hypothetical protein
MLAARPRGARDNLPDDRATVPDPDNALSCWWAETDTSCKGSELWLHIERATPATPGTLVSRGCAPAH